MNEDNEVLRKDKLMP